MFIIHSSNCLSSSNKSATLPCRTHEKKSLLDDSVLGDCMQEETRSSKFNKIEREYDKTKHPFRSIIM